MADETAKMVEMAKLAESEERYDDMAEVASVCKP